MPTVKMNTVKGVIFFILIINLKYILNKK